MDNVAKDTCCALFSAKSASGAIYLIALDSIQPVFSGWVINATNPSQILTCELYANGVCLGRIINIYPRPDLKDKGISTGYGGFRLNSDYFATSVGGQASMTVKFKFPDGTWSSSHEFEIDESHKAATDKSLSCLSLIPGNIYNFEPEQSRRLTGTRGSCLDEVSVDILAFIPIDERRGMLVPQANLHLAEVDFPEGQLFRVPPDELWARAQLVLYSIDINQCIIFINQRDRSFIKITEDNGALVFTQDMNEACRFQLRNNNASFRQIKRCVDAIVYFISKYENISINEVLKYDKIVIDIVLQAIPIQNFIMDHFEIEKIKLKYNTDIFIQKSFKAQPLAYKTVLDSSYRELDKLGWNEKKIYPGHFINHLYRSYMRPQKRCCIAACSRNEGIYLLEWIAYHKLLGIEDIYILSNDNCDDSDYLLDALAENKVIHHIKNSGFYSNALARLVSYFPLLSSEALEHHYCYLIDIDEFVWLDKSKFIGMDDFIDFHIDMSSDCIIINWCKNFINHKISWEEDLVIKRFPHFRKEPNRESKIACNFRTLCSTHHHFPTQAYKKPYRFSHASGASCYPYIDYANSIISKVATAMPEASHALILHYEHKSFEEFIYKYCKNEYEHSRVDCGGGGNDSRQLMELSPRYVKHADNYFNMFKNSFEAKIDNSRIFFGEDDYELINDYITYLRSLPKINDAYLQVRYRTLNLLAAYRSFFISAVDSIRGHKEKVLKFLNENGCTWIDNVND